MIERLYDNDKEAMRVYCAAQLAMQGGDVLQCADNYQVMVGDVETLIQELREMELIYARMSLTGLGRVEQ